MDRPYQTLRLKIEEWQESKSPAIKDIDGFIDDMTHSLSSKGIEPKDECLAEIFETLMMEEESCIRLAIEHVYEQLQKHKDDTGTFQVEVPLYLLKKDGRLRVVDTLKRRNPEQADPMAEISPNEEFPCVPHDYKDVSAELSSSLQPNEIATRMGLTRTTVMNYRKSLKLLGLPQGRHRYVFPAWQLDPSGQLIPEVEEILHILDHVAPRPVDKLILMLMGTEFFEGKSIKDHLVFGNSDAAIKAAKILSGLY